MKLLKLLLLSVVSCSLLLLCYYFVWNFMAGKQRLIIKDMLDNVSYVDFNYKDFNVFGYPDNININVEDLSFNSETFSSKLKIIIGDVLFQIYPFVLEQQAEIKLPAIQKIIADSKTGRTEYKLASKETDFSILNNKLNIQFDGLKLFSITKDKLLLKADKIYYTGFLNNSNRIQVNINNLQLNNGELIDSIALDLQFSGMGQFELLDIILNSVSLQNVKMDNYADKVVEYLKEKDVKIKIKNMKLNSKDYWFEINSNLKLDKRRRFSGKLDLVCDTLQTAENILKLVASTKYIELNQIDIIQRLLKQNQNKLIRVNADFNKGFLYVFNQKLARIKPFELKNYKEK